MELDRLQPRMREVFSSIQHPQYKRSLLDLGMFGGVVADGPDFELLVKTPDEVKEFQIELDARIRRRLKDVELGGKLKIRFEYDQELSQETARLNLKDVKNIIAVGSGKGGVGKSTISANLAMSLVSQGNRVGLVDMDIYGPSLGKMFGMVGQVDLRILRQDKIEPVETHGLKMMSFSFLLDPEQALTWRGPILNNAVHQLLFEIVWGELDYLIIDLPPGTGDVQLSLAQMVNVDGAVIVSTPQSVAIQDAQRAVTMFHQVGVPILGIVENMSEYICPECGHISHIFSRHGMHKLAEQLDVPLLGSIPLQEEIMSSGEEGSPIVAREPEGPIAEIYRKVTSALDEQLAKYKS